MNNYSRIAWSYPNINFYPESLTYLFENGRSPDLFNAIKPSQLKASGIEVINILDEVPNQIEHKLTVAGTVLVSHQIPF